MLALLKNVASMLGLGERAAPAGNELGSYRMVKPLGGGGMGEVWLAEHKLLGRQAALKIVRPEMLADASQREEWLARFEREARATALLESPHTVRLWDYGRAGSGTFYYAMELLEGIDLETLVERFGPMRPARALFVLEQLCASLAEAHAAGLVHRDVKPANVFLSRLGLEHDFVKVLDFGLVSGQVGPERGARITAKDMVVGTPSYMAPEAIAGRVAVDARADVYAVGCVAYWLLTGTHVFGGGDRTPLAVMLDHSHTEPQRPSERTGTPFPVELEDLVMRCLEKDRELRPMNGGDLLARLRAVSAALPRWTEVEAQRWWARFLPELAGPRPTPASTVARRPVVAA